MADERPYYIDDPLVDTGAHRLSVITDDEETTRRGYTAVFGTCSCGEWTCPTYDDNGVLEAFDSHMSAVQEAAHHAAGPDR